MNRILPAQKQLDFLRWEMGVFFHFGIRTFYEGHTDWDGNSMELSRFCPTELNCDSWIETVQRAGFQYAIFVCKHHDGFVNWPTKYSEYSVAHTPWKNGQGDVVRAFSDACEKYGIKKGLYYSPAEAAYQERSAKEYDDYFVNQISELLTNYGKVDYLWFDGCGSEGHTYDEKRIISVIRKLQPDILIFNMWDPDTRWVGNEGGYAGFDNSNIVSDLDFSVMTDQKESLETKRFLPAECDVCIREHNWFYSEYDTHTVKSMAELLGIYYASVGNGSNLLINIGPDRRGLLPETDAARLVEFGDKIKALFSCDLGGRMQAVEAPEKENHEGDVTLTLEKSQLVNHLILEEDLTMGEMVEAFHVYASASKVPAVCIFSGKTIGNKRIVRFPAIRASSFFIKIEQCRGPYKLKSVKAYYVN